MWRRLVDRSCKGRGLTGVYRRGTVCWNLFLEGTESPLTLLYPLSWPISAILSVGWHLLSSTSLCFGSINHISQLPHFHYVNADLLDRSLSKFKHICGKLPAKGEFHVSESVRTEPISVRWLSSHTNTTSSNACTCWFPTVFLADALKPALLLCPFLTLWVSPESMTFAALAIGLGSLWPSV